MSESMSLPLRALRDELRRKPQTTSELMGRLGISRAALDSRRRRLNRIPGYRVVSMRYGNGEALYTLTHEPDPPVRRCQHPGCRTILRSDRAADGERFCEAHKSQPRSLDILIRMLEYDVCEVA